MIINFNKFKLLILLWNFKIIELIKLLKFIEFIYFVKLKINY